MKTKSTTNKAFYEIPLSWPELDLSSGELFRHFPNAKSRLPFRGCWYHFKSFYDGVVTAKTTFKNNAVNHVQFYIDNASLYISCDCGMPGNGLCPHAFLVLDRMSWSSNIGTSKFYRPGLTTITAQRKFLEINVSPEQISVRTRPGYGYIFQREITVARNILPDLGLQTEGTNMPQLAGDEIRPYVLCYYPSKNRYFPCLVPVKPKMANNGLSITGFHKFMPYDDKTPYTNELDETGAAIYALSRKYVLNDGSFSKQAIATAEQTAFEQWQRAWPLIAATPYTYCYCLAWVELRYTPVKRRMLNCGFSTIRPALIFLLQDKGDHYMLSALLYAGEHQISFNDKPHFFVVDTITNQWFLMRTLQDDKLLSWMTAHNNRLTVLKEDFGEFSACFLSRLQKNYQVIFKDMPDTAREL